MKTVKHVFLSFQHTFPLQVKKNQKMQKNEEFDLPALCAQNFLIFSKIERNFLEILRKSSMNYSQEIFLRFWFK